MKHQVLSTYLGRQPIFNEYGQCFAYELLYRSCSVQNSASIEDNTQATTKVIINLIHNFGLSPIIGTKIGFVNIDENMLFSDAILLLPKEYLHFEILEHTKVSLALFERIKYLYSLGYRFSLDDFDCSDSSIKNYELIFPYIDIIKVDVLSIGVENLKSAVDKILEYNIDLLAEKIETYEVYDICKKLPFKFFQGYFFEKPVILGSKTIEPNTFNVIRLMNQLQDNDDINRLTQKFSTCPDLVFNLLRHLNSGAYHLKQQITDVKQMISLLGRSKLISWLGLFLYGDATQKPFGAELFNNAKFRAKMMEELALACGKKELASKAFLTGSLSLINAYLGISMEDFLKNLHLDYEINQALLYEEGFLGELLCLAKEISHSGDVEKTFDTFNKSTFYTKNQLYHACCVANTFVEEFKA